MVRSLVTLLACTIAMTVAVPQAQAQNNPVVLIETSLGTITVELDRENAPISVENFLAYVENGHYAGTIFHRVIKGFMIQGGGFTPDMQQKPTGDPIQNEATNGVSNARGTLAMARVNAPHSATAQFFINTVDNRGLDNSGTSQQAYGYAVFGRVIEGLGTVDQIEDVDTGRRGPYSDVPNTPVEIVSITVTVQ